MVLAKAKTGECREYRDIVIHVGTNDVRMKQSEITKRNIASACISARKMCRHRVIVSGPLPVRGSDELYSRVSQLNRWLKTVFCPSQKLEFVDNWPSFWDSPTNRTKPDLLRSDGLHPSWRGALILSTNIDRALTPLAPQWNRVQARQQAVSQPASIVESATSTVSVVSSAITIETVSVPRPRLGKTKHGGVRLSNLTRIKTTSIPVITERDHDTSHLKIGLLNVRSLTSKAIIVNELITDHNLDVIGLTETWLKPDEFTVLNEASPPGYTSDHIPRASRGGVANIYDSKLKCTNKQKRRFHLLSF
jgi:hypothetical protein